MKRTAERKRETLKRILALIHERYGVKAEDIANLENITLRQAFNYLYDLEALGVVVHNKKLGLWMPKESQSRIVFETRHDYELALNHSKKLLFSDRDNQRFDLMNQQRWADIIIFQNKDWTRSLLSHLKTGYGDLYLLLERYRDSKTKLANLLKIDPAILDFSFSFNNLDEENIAVAKDLIKKITDLSNEIAIHLQSIMFQVEHGIPLKGDCEACPIKHLSIKEDGK